MHRTVDRQALRHVEPARLARSSHYLAYTFDYDASGRLVSLDENGESRVTYRYDNQARLVEEAVATGGSMTPYRASRYVYDCR